jgi:hypothetical protein
VKRSGIKRGTSTLKRGGRLQADPETTRAWQDRSRKPLAPSGPIQRSAPMPTAGRREGPGRPSAARGSIRKASARKTSEGAARRALVGRLAVEGVGCEICPELALIAGIVVPGGCGGLGGIHERRKRSSAGTVGHAPNLVPSCNVANGWIEDNPELARVLFGSWLVLREGDAEWDTCGRDVDPVPVSVAYCPCRGCGGAYVHVPPSMTLPCGHGWEPDHG